MSFFEAALEKPNPGTQLLPKGTGWCSIDMGQIIPKRDLLFNELELACSSTLLVCGRPLRHARCVYELCATLSTTTLLGHRLAPRADLIADAQNMVDHGSYKLGVSASLRRIIAQEL